MSTVVNSIPKATRDRKYDYDTLFDGQIHRLVQGEDFEVARESVRGALYNHKAEVNKANPEAQIGLTVQFRDEDGKSVVYVQKTEPKARKAKAAPAKKAPAAKKADKPAAKVVTPTKAQREKAATEAQ